MGRKAQRRRNRIAKSTVCPICLVELDSKNITEDHYPPKSWFTANQWPKGFSFPACGECNSWSREADRFMAFLIHSSEKTDERAIGLWKGFKNKHDCGRNTFLHSTPLENTADAEIRMQLGKDGWKYVSIVVEKLARYLSFKEHGRPAPKSARIVWSIDTNGAGYTGGFPAKFEESFSKAVSGKRGLETEREFNYRAIISSRGLCDLFYCRFRNVLGIFLLICDSPEIVSAAMVDAQGARLYDLAPERRFWRNEQPPSH